MAWDVKPNLRLKKSLRHALYLSLFALLIFAILYSLAASHAKTRAKYSQSKGGTFDVFDPVHGIFPGQRQLSGQSPGKSKLSKTQKTAKVLLCLGQSHICVEDDDFL